jgi:hypothetical protein
VCAPLQTIFFHCKPVVHGSTNLYNKLTNLSNNLQQSQRRLLLHQSTVGWWLTFPPSPRPGRTACAPCHEAVELDGAPGLSVSVSVCACTRSPVPMQMYAHHREDARTETKEYLLLHARRGAARDHARQSAT